MEGGAGGLGQAVTYRAAVLIIALFLLSCEWPASKVLLLHSRLGRSIFTVHIQYRCAGSLAAITHIRTRCVAKTSAISKRRRHLALASAGCQPYISSSSSNMQLVGFSGQLQHFRRPEINIYNGYPITRGSTLLALSINH